MSSGKIVKHGMSGHPEYALWNSMIGRCHRPRHSGYHRYGGAGITVCDRWRGSFVAFIEDMGPRPSPAHSIDRIDGKRGYEPGNCRWATRAEQNRNKSNNIVISALGKCQTATDWARELGCGFDRVRRLSAKHGGERAIELIASKPVRRRGERASPAGRAVAQLAAEAGISVPAMRWRLDAGWSVQRALSTPLRKR